MAVIAAGAQMRGDPLALDKDLDGARRQSDLDLAAGEAIKDAVEGSPDQDGGNAARGAPPPLGEGIRLAGQALEVRPIELLEQRATGHAKPSDRPLLVELAQQIADRRVEFSQALKAA